MLQYIDIKEKNMDVILFFRLGDFYEMFFEDAYVASKELELTLTGKNAGLDERIPMCGIPYHAASIYLEKLVEDKKPIEVSIRSFITCARIYENAENDDELALAEKMIAEQMRNSSLRGGKKY